MKKYKDRSIFNEFDERSEYKTSEIAMVINGKEYPIDCILAIDEGDFKTEDGIIIISNKLFKRFSPDKINNSYFWKKAFELSSSTICRNIDSRNPDDINKKSFESLHKPCVDYYIKSIFTNNSDAKILEIGTGLGCIMEYIETNYNIDNYFGIDINNYINSDKIFKCDGKSIPDTIKTDFDIIYSINVFQHLTKKQRIGYYRSIKKFLKDDGIFVFSLFCITENNKDMKAPIHIDKSLFNIKNEDGRFVSAFFNQFIIIPTLEEMRTEISDEGLKIKKITENYNIIYFGITK